ncbi:hypothetical protein A2U01_0078267, partial [Trifolium medium]|nr:hypothetical protein [Trifolium medium]
SDNPKLGETLDESKDNTEIINGQSPLSVPVATTDKATLETVDEPVKEKIITSGDVAQDVEASKDLSNPNDVALTESFGSSSESKTSTEKEGT